MSESDEALAEWQQHVADCIELAKRGQATAEMWDVIEMAAGVSHIGFSGQPVVTSHPELIDETLPF